MPLILLNILKEFWKPVAAILIFAIMQFFIWNHGRNFGQEHCAAKYEQQIKERDEAINKQVSELNQTSNKLADTQKVDVQNLRRDLQKIITQVREGKQPVVIFKDGNCLPTETFVDAVNKINKRVNETP